jgi:hypothetical protein
MVGSIPPPVPEPMHWLTLAGSPVAVPVILLTTSTAQVTVPPPPLPEPSHWVTEMTGWWGRLVTVVVQVGSAFAAPWHSVTVALELERPVLRSRLFVTDTVHTTAWPPALSVPLH